MFEADLSASWSNLQRILDFLSLRNLFSNELFLLLLIAIVFLLNSARTLVTLALVGCQSWEVQILEDI